MTKSAKSAKCAHLSRLRLLARGEPGGLALWLREPVTRESLAALIVVIIIGCAFYGFGLGLWWAPLQGAYVAIKMPLLISLNLLVNGLINGMFGQLLGSGISFRQTVVACLMSFAIFSLIVGSFSPILIAWVLDAPPPGTTEGTDWYRVFLGFRMIGLFFGTGLLTRVVGSLGSESPGYMKVWVVIFTLVNLQMSTSLRPLIGTADNFFPEKKKFFVHHWLYHLDADNPPERRVMKTEQER